MKTNTNIQSLARCKARMIKEGYTENFLVEMDGFVSEKSGKHYNDKEIRIVSRLVFGAGNRNNVSAIYVIEANDGTKGIALPNQGTIKSF